MVSEIESRPATEAEVEAQQALATQKLREGRLNEGQQVSEGKDIPGLIARPGQKAAMTYKIPAADAASWVLCWELFLDKDGQVFGKATRAPRGQLGLWLMKTRPEDGGPRFQMEMPGRVISAPQYPCLHDTCKRRKHTRAELVEHVEVCHPRTARIYRKTLDKFIEEAANENPRVKEIEERYASMPESGLLSVPSDGSVETPTNIDITAGKPTVHSFGVSVEETPDIFRCRKDGCKRFFDSEQGRVIHEGKPH